MEDREKVIENKEEVIDITDNGYIISSFIKLENGFMFLDYDLPYHKQKEMERNERNEKNVNV